MSHKFEDFMPDYAIEALDRAEEILKKIIEVNDSVRDIYDASYDSASGELDLAKFLAKLSATGMGSRLMSVKQAELEEAHNALKLRRALIMKSGNFSHEILDELSVLADAGTELAIGQMRLGLEPEYVKWFATKAAPYAAKVLKVVFKAYDWSEDKISDLADKLPG